MVVVVINHHHRSEDGDTESALPRGLPETDRRISIIGPNSPTDTADTEPRSRAADSPKQLRHNTGGLHGGANVAPPSFSKVQRLRPSSRADRARAG